MLFTIMVCMRRWYLGNFCQFILGVHGGGLFWFWQPVFIQGSRMCEVAEHNGIQLVPNPIMCTSDQSVQHLRAHFSCWEIYYIKIFEAR
jgi:hypothetical protein